MESKSNITNSPLLYLNSSNRNKPWSKQKTLQQSNERVTSQAEIIEIAISIKNDRLRTLFLLCYLSGCRICEAVRKYKYNIVEGKKIRIKNDIKPSILRRNIELITQNERPIVLIFLRNQKHRKRFTKEIPIPLDNENNKKMYDLMNIYLSTIGPNQELFPFGYQYAYRLLKPYFNPHWLRHIRSTHLAVNNDFTEQELMNYMGWTDSRPAGRYTELKWHDFLKKL